MSVCGAPARLAERRLLTALGATCPPAVVAMLVESSNRSFSPLLMGAGVGDGANVFGTDEGMKFWPTCVTHKHTHTHTHTKRKVRV